MPSIFSKPINDTKSNNIITTDNDNKNIFVKTVDILKFNDYFNNNVNLSIYKLYELKPICKFYKLNVSGKKKEITDRLNNFFINTKHSILIQTWWRKYIVLLSYKLRGPALKNRSICTNDVDFSTLDPINTIENNSFFSYTGEDNFTYGFDFSSLIELFNREHDPFNPFNRKKFSKQVINNVIKLYNITNIIFDTNNRDTTTNFDLHNMIIPDNYSEMGLGMPYFRPVPYNRTLLTNNSKKMKYINICGIRIDNIDRRIANIFYTFDSYDNYTSSDWFYGLSFTKLVSLYKQIYEIWHSRVAVILNIDKRKICCLFDPFQIIHRRSIIYSRENHDDCVHVMRILAITVMENMIYQSIDEEYSKIGALHCLTALTVVSSHARIAMPWLYESIF
jgi:hypothetical protein